MARVNSAQLLSEDRLPRVDAGAADQLEHHPPRIDAAADAASSIGGRALDIALTFRSLIPRTIVTSVFNPSCGQERKHALSPVRCCCDP